MFDFSALTPRSEERPQPCVSSTLLHVTVLRVIPNPWLLVGMCFGPGRCAAPQAATRSRYSCLAGQAPRWSDNRIISADGISVLRTIPSVVMTEGDQPEHRRSKETSRRCSGSWCQTPRNLVRRSPLYPCICFIRLS